ncbi:PEP-CTERM sorting domain-containing protein [Aeoliella sp. SH292]|uniref:PEP-CTERM sorting domain-containing protein n=1 Tax=Aeoliella sp. SH292 TaxID=3454464 RepID=UPI003F9B3E2F
MRLIILLVVAIAVASCPQVVAQTLGVDFAADYSVVDLGGPPDVPANLGGITFLDADTILVGGAANGAAGAIYAVDVLRDPVSNSVTGFAGPATLYANAPNIDGGLQFGPGGVLFYTAYPVNGLAQILPGETDPAKTVGLTAEGVASSVGALAFVPSGFPGAGQLKLASYNANTWYTATLSPDGLGTYDIAGLSAALPVSGGPEGIVYIDGANAAFGVDSVLISEYSLGRVVAYEIDAEGDPIISTGRAFITGLSGAEGAAIDPVTGDFYFSTFGGGNRIVYASGFITPIPEPSSLLLLGGLVAVAALRRVRG